MAVTEQSSVPPQTANLIPVTNPVSGEIIGEIPVTLPEGVTEAVERARRAQSAWGALRVEERARLLTRWRTLLWDRQEEGIEILRRENGKTEASALLEFAIVDNIAGYYITHGANILKPENRRALFPIFQAAHVYHKPHGVVGIITPWNYPLMLLFVDAFAALIAGNCVVAKPSEITPFIADWGVELLREAGIPQDVMQLVHGDGSTGAALVEQVDYLQFTGSTRVGRMIGKRCAERLIPYSLELGGKDPAIVLSDVDPKQVAVSLMQGAFENAGQACISIERVYVEEAIYDPLVEALQVYAPQMTLGTGENATMGSLTNENELRRTQAHIADALEKGATLLSGGNPRPDLGPLFFEPTILVNVDHTMDVMREETFGPVLPLMKVRDEREAIRLANDSHYGLSGTVFGKDLARAEAVAIQIDSGDININRPGFAFGTPALPIGGQKESGMGRRNGKEGLLKYTASQSIMIDKMFVAEESLVIASPFAMQAHRLVRLLRKLLPFV
ncbi:MAG: aldehyde dehydrogenase family protein [Anaerolineae bacterium]|nr:aldehyde dehydrogenase family protein [Anaerolineae bacterium]